jgi:hypothetical protein
MYIAVQRTVHSCRDETRLAVFSVPFPQPSFQTCFFLAFDLHSFAEISPKKCYNVSSPLTIIVLMLFSCL